MGISVPNMKTLKSGENFAVMVAGKHLQVWPQSTVRALKYLIATELLSGRRSGLTSGFSLVFAGVELTNDSVQLDAIGLREGAIIDLEGLTQSELKQATAHES